MTLDQSIHNIEWNVCVDSISMQCYLPTCRWYNSFSKSVIFLTQIEAILCSTRRHPTLQHRITWHSAEESILVCLDYTQLTGMCRKSIVKACAHTGSRVCKQNTGHVMQDPKAYLDHDNTKGVIWYICLANLSWDKGHATWQNTDFRPSISHMIICNFIIYLFSYTFLNFSICFR